MIFKKLKSYNLQPTTYKLQPTSYNLQPNRGFSLVELLVTIGILVIIMLGIYGMFSMAHKTLGSSNAKIIATQLANQQMEIIRNLPYAKIGTTEGWPHGEILSSQKITKNGIEFTIQTTPTYIDDSFDGLAPNDTTPSDYKKVEVKISWNKFSCKALSLISTFSPKGVESASNSGTLFIKVFDANGIDVPQASVYVVNTDIEPDIIINAQTNNEGLLQLFSLPVSSNKYHIEATKQGFSTDYTLPSNPPSNPNPIKQDASVLENQITSISFSIDKLSSLNIYSVDENCLSIGNADFNFQGLKLIGSDPNVYKYSQSHITDSSGKFIFNNNLEWDTYTTDLISPTMDNYNLIGTNPLQPLGIQPNTTQDFYLILKPKTNDNLLVVVKDAGSNQPLSGAQVRLYKTGYDEIKITGYGVLRQTDWHGGSGQENFIDQTKYFSDNENIDALSSQGNVTLLPLIGQPTEQFKEEFENTIYKDEAQTTAEWDIQENEARLKYENGQYHSSDVVQSLRVNTANRIINKATIAINQKLNGQTIDLFLSANGGNNFELISQGQSHDFINPGYDLRWKAILRTDDPQKTPIIEKIILNWRYSGTYPVSGELVSSTFDVNNAIVNYGNIFWQPETQTQNCGADCLKFQIATSSIISPLTWEFKGPDGTSDTYYINSNTAINVAHDNHRYFRYKAFLSTQDADYSPILSDVFVSFTTACSIPGQVFFPSLEKEIYTLEINMTGYQFFSDTVDISTINKLEIPLSKSE
ncbi:MAG: prepilin-type N-terminal cleavage/methylation domain-containing protein [Candidatus Kuenenbacteria bacterium]